MLKYKLYFTLTVTYLLFFVNDVSSINNVINGSLDSNWDMKFTVFVKTPEGLVLYASNKENRILILFSSKRLIFAYNTFKEVIKLKDLCLSSTVVDFWIEFNLQHSKENTKYSMECEGKKTESLMSTTGNYKNWHVYPIENKNKNSIFIWMGNIEKYKNTKGITKYPLKHSLGGCLNTFYYNNNKFENFTGITHGFNGTCSTCPSFCCSSKSCNGKECQEKEDCLVPACHCGKKPNNVTPTPAIQKKQIEYTALTSIEKEKPSTYTTLTSIENEKPSTYTSLYSIVKEKPSTSASTSSIQKEQNEYSKIATMPSNAEKQEQKGGHKSLEHKNVQQNTIFTFTFIATIGFVTALVFIAINIMMFLRKKKIRNNIQERNYLQDYAPQETLNDANLIYDILDYNFTYDTEYLEPTSVDSFSRGSMENEEPPCLPPRNEEI